VTQQGPSRITKAGNTINSQFSMLNDQFSMIAANWTLNIDTL